MKIRINKVLEYLKTHESIRTADIGEPLEISPAVSRRLMNLMVEKDILYSKGKNKGKVYFLKK